MTALRRMAIMLWGLWTRRRGRKGNDDDRYRSAHGAQWAAADEAMRLMNALRKLARAIEDVLMVLSAASFLAIMGVMVIDVLLRYLASSPLGWSFELLTRYLVLTAFFFAVSYTWRRDDHLYVEIVYRMLPVRPRSAILFVLHVAITAIIGAMFWLAVETTNESWQAGERLVGDIPWPVWTSHVIVAIGLGALAIRAVERTLTLLLIAIGIEDETVLPTHSEDSI